MFRATSAMAAVLVAGLTVGVPRPALALDWPDTEGNPATDPVEPLRWRHIPSWFASSPTDVRQVLARLSRGAADDPRAEAGRALALRLLNHESEARAALARAVTVRPSVLEDPDIALTAAYLAARDRDYATAVDLARAALPRMEDHSPREGLVLEIARWSMARGPEGLPPAQAVLRGWLTVAAGTPLVRATLALALARTGTEETHREAVAIARSVRPGMRATDGDQDAPLIGPTVVGEGRAAIGLCLLLAGDHPGVQASVVPLETAVTRVPAPWRAFQTGLLATAHRLAPEVALTVEETPPVGAADRSPGSPSVRPP